MFEKTPFFFIAIVFTISSRCVSASEETTPGHGKIEETSTPADLAHHEDAASLRPFLDVKYKLVSSDSNFGKVLKVLGISWLERIIFKELRPTLVLSYDPNADKYTLIHHSFVMDDKVTFKLEEEFGRETLDERLVQAKFTLRGATLTETQAQDGKPTLVIDREFTPDNVIVKTKIENFISYRVYNRLLQ